MFANQINICIEYLYLNEKLLVVKIGGTTCTNTSRSTSECKLKKGIFRVNLYFGDLEVVQYKHTSNKHTRVSYGMYFSKVF